MNSWRRECADLWRVIAQQRHDAGDHQGYVQAHRNRETLGAAHNIANNQPQANYR